MTYIPTSYAESWAADIKATIRKKPRYRVLMMPITRPYNWRGTGDILRYQQFCNNNPINPLQTRTELQINLIVKL